MKQSSGKQPTVENGHLKKPAVIAAFKGCASVTKACEIADICRDTFYRWLKEDPEFREAFEKSREEAVRSSETLRLVSLRLYSRVRQIRQSMMSHGKHWNMRGPGGIAKARNHRFQRMPMHYWRPSGSTEKPQLMRQPSMC